MAAINTNNKLGIVSGGLACVTNTPTRMSSTSLFVSEVIIDVVTNAFVIGGSDVDFTAGSRNGLLISAGTAVTLTAGSAEARGFHGTRRGEVFIDLYEIWMDSDGTNWVTFFGFGTGTETA